MSKVCDSHADWLMVAVILGRPLCIFGFVYKNSCAESCASQSYDAELFLSKKLTCQLQMKYHHLCCAHISEDIFNPVLSFGLKHWMSW